MSWQSVRTIKRTIRAILGFRVGTGSEVVNPADFRFLVADTQLYKRLCPSVRPLVRWSVGPLVRDHESKSGKTSV